MGKICTHDHSRDSFLEELLCTLFIRSKFWRYLPRQQSNPRGQVGFMLKSMTHYYLLLEAWPDPESNGTRWLCDCIRSPIFTISLASRRQNKNIVQLIAHVEHVAPVLLLKGMQKKNWCSCSWCGPSPSLQPWHLRDTSFLLDDFATNMLVIMNTAVCWCWLSSIT